MVIVTGVGVGILAYGSIKLAMEIHQKNENIKRCDELLDMLDASSTWEDLAAMMDIQPDTRPRLFRTKEMKVTIRQRT